MYNLVLDISILIEKKLMIKTMTNSFWKLQADFTCFCLLCQRLLSQDRGKAEFQHHVASSMKELLERLEKTTTTTTKPVNIYSSENAQ